MPHIPSIRQEGAAAAAPDPTKKPRRWVHTSVNVVVERTFSWLCRWRGILIRWEKKPRNYLASLTLACALLWFRRAHQLGSPILR